MRAILRRLGRTSSILLAGVVVACVGEVDPGSKCTVIAANDVWQQKVSHRVVSPPPSQCPLKLTTRPQFQDYAADLLVPVIEANSYVNSTIRSTDGTAVGISAARFDLSTDNGGALAHETGSYYAGRPPSVGISLDNQDIAETQIGLIVSGQTATASVGLPYAFLTSAGPSLTRASIRQVKKGTTIQVRAWARANVPASQTWNWPTGQWKFGGSGLPTTRSNIYIGVLGSPILLEYSASRLMNTLGTFTWTFVLTIPPYNATATETLTMTVVP